MGNKRSTRSTSEYHSNAFSSAVDVEGRGGQHHTFKCISSAVEAFMHNINK